MPHKNRSFVFLGQSGCLLPLMILFNFVFGWLFFRPLVWLSIEGILILLFLINSYILVKKVSSFSSKKSDNVIDVEAEVEDQGRRFP